MVISMNILGREYTIEYKTEKEDEVLNDSDGYTEVSTAKIVINDFNDWNEEARKYMKAKVLRHELIHAFLHESGLSLSTTNKWAMNEEMVDWIAIQIPKMIQVMKEAGCLDD